MRVSAPEGVTLENQEVVLPEAEAQADAGASDQQTADLANQEGQQEAQEAKEGEQKPEKDPELRRLEKELAKERRRNQAIARRMHEAEYKAREIENLRSKPIDATNEASEGNSQRQSLTDADLDALLEQREQQRRQADSQRELASKAAALRKELGDDFESTTEDLSLMLRDGKKQLAVLRSERPAELIRYLTDPDNAEEVERMARMDDFDYGRSLARIEARLEAKPTKPQASKAPAPIEPVRGGGVVKEQAAPQSMEAYMAWANKQYSRR